jgi:hypothetical protein
MVDSAAWKLLSEDACWLHTQLQRQWRIDGLGRPFFILPFSHVEYRWGFPRFKRARRELVALGFIDLKDPGGIARAGGAKPAIYGPSTRWQEISKKILADPTKGHVVYRQVGTSRVSTWEPFKPKGRHSDNISSFNRRQQPEGGKSHDPRPKQHQSADPIPG